MKSSQKAFTLLELMVVIVLIGIMTAMILPEMKGTYEDALLRSTSRTLVDAFNLANSRAITLNQLHRVRVDPKAGRYLVERQMRERESGSGFVPLRDLPGGEGEIGTRIVVEIRKTALAPGDGPEAPLEPGQDERVSSPDQAICFYPDGTADAIEVLLRDREGFGLGLRLNPVTARVHIVELERK